MATKRFSIDWDDLLNITVPIFATIILLLEIRDIWDYPQLRGTLGMMDVALVLAFTVVNIFLHRLIHGGYNLAFLILILVNLVALAIWYKHLMFLRWIGISISPLGYHLLFYKR